MSERLARFLKTSGAANGAKGAIGKGANVEKDKDSLSIGMNGLAYPNPDNCTHAVSANSADSFGSVPAVACGACGCGKFHRAPGERWQCSACDPVTLPPAHEQAGWAFCAVPGGEAIARAPLSYSPGWQGWPDEEPRQPALPDLAMAPIGKCAGCRFTAPLTAEGLCGRCAWARAT